MNKKNLNFKIKNLIEEKYDFFLMIEIEKNETDEIMKKYFSDVELLLYIEKIKKKYFAYGVYMSNL